MSEVRILIVGAGFGGIGAAIELRRHGFEQITILERAAGIGGTWLYNSYPGSACDVPSHLYSFSFAQRRDWSRLCSPQAEILDYIRAVAREHDVERHVIGGVEIEACAWDQSSGIWTVSSSDDRKWEAETLIIATGQLHRKLVPPIEGIESFAGHSFHSAEWDHDYELAGKRVGVVGSGASAVQFVPAVAEQAGRLTIFQRSGNWLLPRKNHAYPALFRAAVRSVPGFQALRRRFVFNYGESVTMMIRHPRTLGLLGRLRSSLFMRWQLRDRELRRKVWPDYTFGCKRVLFSSHWLPALQRENVELVTDAAAAVTPGGIRTANGVEHELDCIIWGTGFRTNDFMFPMAIRGRDGLELRDAWAGGPHAYLGITVPGFPSMFVMYGPNTNTSGGSIIFYLETQAAYIRQALERVRDSGAAAIEVRAEVEAAADRQLQSRFEGTAWTRCDSWYRDESGRIVANWPGYMREYLAAAETLDPADYELIGIGERREPLEPLTESA